MKNKRTALLVATMALLTVGVGTEQAVASTLAHTAVPAAHPKVKVISFTAQRETVHQVDVAPTGPSIGDETFIGGKIIKGNARGYTSAQCITVTTEDHNIAQCEVDFLLQDGTILTLGTSTDTSPAVSLAIVGGTGSYAGAAGSGTLRPTSRGSQVALHLR